MAKKNQNQNRTFVTKQKYLRNAAKYEVNRRGGGRNRPLRSRGHFVSRHQNLGASAPQSVPVPTAPPSQEQ